MILLASLFLFSFSFVKDQTAPFQLKQIVVFEVSRVQSSLFHCVIAIEFDYWVTTDLFTVLHAGWMFHMNYDKKE